MIINDVKNCSKTLYYLVLPIVCIMVVDPCNIWDPDLLFIVMDPDPKMFIQFMSYEKILIEQLEKGAFS